MKILILIVLDFRGQTSKYTCLRRARFTTPTCSLMEERSIDDKCVLAYHSIAECELRAGSRFRSL